MLLDLAFSLALRLADAIARLLPQMPEPWLVFFDQFRVSMTLIGETVPIVAYLPVQGMLPWLYGYISLAGSVMLAGIVRRILKTIQGWISGGSGK